MKLSRIVLLLCAAVVAIDVMTVVAIVYIIRAFTG